jgi:hypothetical protein
MSQGTVSRGPSHDPQRHTRDRWLAAVLATVALGAPGLAAAGAGASPAVTAEPLRLERALAVEPATWTGRNPALGATMTVTVDGDLELALDGAGAEPTVVRLSLAGIGGEGAAHSVPVLEAWPQGARLVLDRGELRHDLVNDGPGIVQILRLDAPPVGWDGASALELAFELTDGTVATILGEQAVRLEAAADPGHALADFRLSAFETAAGHRPSVRFEVAESTVLVLLDATPGDFPMTLTLLLETPTWVIWGGQEYAHAGYAVATAGDVNGDGYSDVVVGTPDWSGGQDDEGRVRVFHGGPAGLFNTASWSWEPNQAGARAGWSVSTAGDVNGDGYSDLIVGAPYWNGPAGSDQGAAFLFLGSASGLAATPHVVLTFAYAGGHFGFSVTTAGDVNSDGYSDVVVGAPEAYLGTGLHPAGGAFVFHGSSSGVDATPEWSRSGADGTYDNFGYRVAFAGDVNGDGYSDILIGSPDADQGGCGFPGYPVDCQWGRVVGYLGSASGVGSVFLHTLSEWSPGLEGPHQWCRIGQSLATLGDVNGDGFSDIAVGTPGGGGLGCVAGNGDRVRGLTRLWRGTSGGVVELNEIVGLEPNSIGRGASLSTAGDVNGDGFADLVLGEHDPDELDSVGRLIVRLGTPSGFEGEFVIDPGYQSTGWAVALAGDVNGDGYSDLIGGAPYANGTLDNEGAAFVWYGRDTGAEAATDAVWIDGEAGDYELGQALAFMDANQDGIDDLLIGAPGYNGERGAVYLHLGRAGQMPDPTPTRLYATLGVFDWQGTSLAAGDLNGDRLEDLVAGAPGAGVGGEIRIYCGVAGTSPSTTPCATLSGVLGDFLGASVAVLGDVNGDGIADLAAGAPYHRVGTIEFGAVYVWLGTTDGIDGAPDATILGPQAGAEFGKVIARTGDVNRDGFADLAVAAPFFDNGGLANAGGVWVYHGRQAAPPDTTADRQLLGGEALALFGYGLAGAGDTNGDGYADLIVGQPYRDVGGSNTGRAILYRGSVTGISTSASWTVDGTAADEHLGWTVAGGGDVNGDGLADVLVASPDAETLYLGTPQATAGKARLFFGSSAGISEAPEPVLGMLEGGRLGRAAAMAGDINGDGFADPVLGAPWADDKAGMVVVSSPKLGPALKPRQLDATVGGLVPYQSAAVAADEFRVSLGTRTLFGRGYVDLEVEAKPLGTAFNGLGLLRDASWSNSSGVPNLVQDVEGLAASTLYHWRSRQVYRSTSLPLQPHGPWRTRPLGSWAEADIRTLPATAADLRVSIATNAAQIDLGNQYFATITVSNLSSGFAAEDVELTVWGTFDTLNGLTVTAGVNGSCSLVTSDWVCTFTDPIPTGSSRVVFAYGDTNAIGNVTMNVQVSSSNGDLDLGNNYDSESTPVVLPPGLELIVTATGNDNDATPGNGVCETALGNGVCTLRAAVGEANALAGKNTVTIAVTGTITVSGGIAITDDVTIRSGLRGRAVISGSGSSLLFAVADASLPEVDFEGLELVDASYDEAGSAVFLDEAGDVTFTDCVISGSGSGGGGAIGVGAYSGNLLFDGCAFADNASATSGAAIALAGDPIYQRGLLEIRSSTFNSNAAGTSSEGGGAISVSNTFWDVLISDSSFINNTDDTGGGGAILFDADPLNPITADIERSSFSFNSTAGNDGGAIRSNQADVHLVNCTLSDNDAVSGGAISASGGRLAMSSTTLVGNTASDSGGGVGGSAGVEVLAVATVSSGNSPANCAAIATLTGDFNLSSDASCVFSGSSNLSSTPALLGAAVGGPGGLVYYPPINGSPALDSAAIGLCLDVFGDNIDDDMIGQSRPADGTGDGVAICDRGAIEIEVPSEPAMFADGFESGNATAWSAHVP